MHQLRVLLLEGCYAGSVTGLVDLLHFANQIAAYKGRSKPFDWRLFSLDGQAVTTASGIVLTADGGPELTDAADTLVLPPISYRRLSDFETRLMAEQTAGALATRQHAAGRRVMSFCTGVPLLAEHGLLDGRQATVSWWLHHWFRQRYPKVLLQDYTTCSESDGIWCGGATTSYIDLALRLIRHEGGAELAMSCSRLMLTDLNRVSQAPYITMRSFAGHDDELVLRCQDWLQRQLDQPYRLEALSASVGASERTIMRRFQQVLGQPPLRYLQQLRLQAARHLLETSTLPLDEIVSRVGYADIASFRRLFQRELHCTPAEYRRRFAS
ncbi:GlxA family transcriptional regulator [Aquitalea pelogenes]|uniref:GlxA family transcriptional regulator n=1 Tax=Aquitalea pelogenes TaxID=1293573 RepID=UPI00078821CC|nr:helix-turn-helix domain-containing protein [Aquitalea pelogenes]